MNIEEFMRGYKAAWEQRDELMFAGLFLPDGKYHNTPFQTQVGTQQLAEYWRRIKLQDHPKLTFEILFENGSTGFAHWHVTYQVASEELFQIWAKSAGTGLPSRQPGDPLPKMVLDGVLQAAFSGDLCAEARIWWHSLPVPS